MQYFVLPIFLVIFFELLGQVTVQKFNIRKFKFNAIIGFALFMGLYYAICFPLVIIHAKFKLVLIVTLLYFLLNVLYIFKHRKYIKINIFNKYLLIVIVLVCLQFSFALKNTIGSISLYDTVNYTNLVTSNIYLDGLNTFDFTNGYPNSLYGYAFQSYYILASVLYYIINGLSNLAHIDFFYFTQHTWMYSTILYFLFAEMIVNFVDYFKIKKKISYLFILFFIVFFMGNFYWNSEQAYLGNSFRMLLVSYSLVYLFDFFKNKKSNDLIMFNLINLANCSCADTNATLYLIIIFFVWIFIENNEKNIKILSLFITLPAINILYHITHSLNYGILIIAFIVSIWIFSNLYVKLIDKLHLKLVLLVTVTFALLIGSFLITKNIFDFDAFLNNLSGHSDMTWDYTDSSKLWRLFANLIYLVILIYVYYVNRKNRMFQMLLLLMIVFFNPFAAPLQNKHMIVFYRNYDICMNYFIIFMAIAIAENKLLNITTACIIVILSLVPAFSQLNYHPNDSFDLYEGYNPLLRMSKDEADTIKFVKDFVINNGMYGDIKTISSILQVHTEMPWLKTLYGRNKSYNGISDYELYKVFYPLDYYGDPWAPKDPQYDQMCELIKKEEYQLIIQDKRVDYYDEKEDSYYSIRYLIDKCGSYPIYENETFVVYSYEY